MILNNYFQMSNQKLQNYSTKLLANLCCLKDYHKHVKNMGLHCKVRNYKQLFLPVLPDY